MNFCSIYFTKYTKWTFKAGSLWSAFTTFWNCRELPESILLELFSKDFFFLSSWLLSWHLIVQRKCLESRFNLRYIDYLCFESYLNIFFGLMKSQVYQSINFKCFVIVTICKTLELVYWPIFVVYHTDYIVLFYIVYSAVKYFHNWVFISWKAFRAHQTYSTIINHGRQSTVRYCCLWSIRFHWKICRSWSCENLQRKENCNRR